MSLFVALLAASAIAPPPGGTPLLGPDPMSVLALLGVPEYGTLTRVTVEGQPFTQAIRVETLRRPPLDYNVQLGAFTREAVTEGDVVFISFYIRATKGQPETGEGRANLGFATGAPEWTPSVRLNVSPTREWKRFDLPFRVLHTRPAGGSIVSFSLGYSPQIVEVGDFRIVNYGKSVKIEDLPRTRNDYRGQEPDAAWRKAAQDRIERIRKGPYAISVVGADGKPLANAAISIRQTRHAFLFGTAIAADRLFMTGPDADKYRETLKKYFNQASVENHLKWPFWEEWARLDGLKAIEWLKREKFNVRAHTLIWPGYGNLPKDLPQYADQPTLLRRRIAARFADATTATKGFIDDWDVVNEPFTNNDLIKILGIDEVAEWFRLAKKGDPTARLTLNDYPALDGAGLQSDPHLKYHYDLVERLVKAKAPVEAIGFQGHFGSSVVPPERVLSGLDAFAKFNLPILITEFDMDSVDPDLQARYMRDFLTACFSHPSVACITQWGFWAGSHWFPNAALWANDWTLRPHGKVYLDLVYGEWMTKREGKTDANGRLAGRAFFGDYEATITANGRTVTLPFQVAAGQDRISLRLPR